MMPRVQYIHLSSVPNTLSVSSVLRAIRLANSCIRGETHFKIRFVDILGTTSYHSSNILISRSIYFLTMQSLVQWLLYMFRRRVPGSLPLYTIRKIHIHLMPLKANACPSLPDPYPSSLPSCRSRSLILYIYVHVYRSEPLSLFALHLALEEADFLPQGACLTLALESKFPP